MSASTPNNSSNPWFAVSLLLIGLIVGYVLGGSLSGGIKLPSVPSLAGNDDTPPDDQPTQPSGTAPDTGVGPVTGKSSATVTVVEFTDFQCPYCGRHFTQTYGQLKKDYIDTGKIKYESRNFPLTSIHPNAMPSAEAAGQVLGNA